MMTPEFLDEVTCENKAAGEFILAYTDLCHVLDDIVDEPGKIDDKRMIGSLLRFLRSLTLNPWIAQHQVPIMTLISSGFPAWLVANEWEKNGSEFEKRDVDVLKGLYHEVVWYICEQCGGYDHALKMTMKYREYDHDYKEVK